MAQQDSHPADGLISAVKGIFNGQNLEDSIREAWDRHFGSQPAPQPQNDSSQYQSNWTPEPNAEQKAQMAKESALSGSQAARIRAKASKATGSK